MDQSYLQRNNAYLARQEIDAIKSYWFQENNKRLEPYGNKVYSQGDEDGIIEEIFYRLGIFSGTFAEIGLENGMECNTHYLLHKNWVGYWFEADSSKSSSIHNSFISFIKKDKLRVAIGQITKENINKNFNSLGVPQDLDFLSIDVDGMDIHLLEALEIKPKVICIEYNAKWPANAIRVPVYNTHYRWDGTDYMGSSLKAINEVADRKGYDLVGTNITGANAFFVRKDLVGDNFSEDKTPEYLYNPPRYWLIYDHYWYVGHPAGVGEYI
jgi:hypothetical protein